MIHTYPFSVSFSGDAARFPFFYEGQPLEEPFCALSSRSFGNVLELNDGQYPVREAFYRSQGYDPLHCYACTQTHSRRVIIIDKHTPNTYPEGDGLLTLNPELALSVTVADCLPIFLYDTNTRALGMLHSGWKGTGIVRTALETMNRSWGTRPEEVAAVLGPCIQGCCYQVDEERAGVFEAEFGSLKSTYPLGRVTKITETHDQTGDLWYLKLQAANAALLEEAGVRHMAYAEDCTFMDDRFGSFRREGQTYTRMAALAGKIRIQDER